MTTTAYDSGRACAVTYPHPLVMSDRRLSPRQRQQRTVDALALRIIAGFYAGSLSALAAENGISRQLLSKHVRQLGDRLGIDPKFLSDEHRCRLAAAARSAWQRRKRKKADAGTTPTPAENQKLNSCQK